jgi:hypothetical protein
MTVLNRRGPSTRGHVLHHVPPTYLRQGWRLTTSRSRRLVREMRHHSFTRPRPVESPSALARPRCGDRLQCIGTSPDAPSPLVPNTTNRRPSRPRGARVMYCRVQYGRRRSTSPASLAPAPTTHAITGPVSSRPEGNHRWGEARGQARGWCFELRTAGGASCTRCPRQEASRQNRPLSTRPGDSTGLLSREASPACKARIQARPDPERECFVGSRHGRMRHMFR